MKKLTDRGCRIQESSGILAIQVAQTDGQLDLRFEFCLRPERDRNV